MKDYDIDVERSVLGCLIVFESLQEKISLISEEDFYFPLHQSICKILKTLNGEKIDFVKLSANTGDDEKKALTACVQSAISAAMFDEHFAILKAMASQRRIVNKLNELIYTNNATVQSLQEVIEDEQGKGTITSAKDVGRRNIANFIETLNIEQPHIDTGFSKLDNYLGGIRYGTTFIVGARPSTGKTTFAINIAINQIKQSKKTLFFSLEMSAKMIYERMLACKCNIFYDDFCKNRLTDKNVEQVKSEMRDIYKANSFICFDNVYSAEQISLLTLEEKPDLVIVDFMQNITTNERFDSTRTRIDYISALLKRTAKQANCVMMILSQVTRSGKGEPTMSDLKESGGLEQDGDYIVLLHRPYVNDKNNEELSEKTTQVLLDKNKFGGCVVDNMNFDGDYQRFTEVDTFHNENNKRYEVYEDDIEI